MIQRNSVFKCDVCGFVMEAAVGCECENPEILCCGKPMKLLDAKTAETKTEKHVPYPSATEKGGMHVVVGQNMEHPMLPEHYIVWIEVLNGPYVNRKYLKPGEKPSADFYVPLQKGMIIREYCNVHGLWTYEVK